jgi:hypothetical protein
MARQQLGEVCAGGRAREEIGPQRDDDDRPPLGGSGRVAQVVDESLALL